MKGVEADAARRIIGVYASFVAREWLGRRGRPGHSLRARRPERLRVEGNGSGGEGMVARGKKKHAMPCIASLLRLRPHAFRFCRALPSPLIFSSSGLPDLRPVETVVVVVVVAVAAWRVLWMNVFVSWSASMSCSKSCPGYVRLSDYRLAPRWHFFGGISSR